MKRLLVVILVLLVVCNQLFSAEACGRRGGGCGCGGGGGCGCRRKKRDVLQRDTSFFSDSPLMKKIMTTLKDTEELIKGVEQQQ